jgi:hypothetical protein
MKTTAAGIGSAVGVGYGAAGSARAVPPVLLGAGAAGAAGLGYAFYKKAKQFLGDQRDYSDFTGDDALQRELVVGSKRLQSADERVLTSLRNNLTNSKTVGLAKGKAAAIEAMNAGKTEQQATSDMEEAVNSYFAVIQENLFTHFSAQCSQFANMAMRVVERDTMENGVILAYSRTGYTEANYSDRWEPVTKNVSLVDTREIPVTFFKGRNGDNRKRYFDPMDLAGLDNVNKWGVKDPDTGENVYALKAENYEGIPTKITDTRDAVLSDLSGFVADVYDEYGQKNIPSEDVIDPITAATELGTNTGLSQREAAAGMMGISSTADYNLRIRIQGESGEIEEVDAEIYTNVQPTDADGNATGFQVGTTYDPANYQKPIYAAYDYVEPSTGVNTSDFTELVNPFTVLEAQNRNGEEVNTVETTSNINQTADVSKLEEELEQLRKEQVRLQEKAENQNSGGAGAGFFGSNGPSTGAIAAVLGGVGVVYALFTQGES